MKNRPQIEMEYKCKICGNVSGNKHYKIRERMFNYKKEFEYLLCKKCYTLQLWENVQNLSDYYPENYGGFTPISFPSKTKWEDISNRFISSLLLKCFYNNRLSQKVLESRFQYLQCLMGLNINKKSRILDVGCGGGRWLDKLQNVGFCNLTGVDLYHPKEDGSKKGWKFISGEIYDIRKVKYDLITFHHSFEHMNEPLNILKKAYELLEEKGTCMIRIPVMGKYAWRKYKTDWVQIDAPRHLFLYHEKGMKLLAQMSGFRIDKVVYDSTDFQIWGSELYQKKEISLSEAQKKLKYMFPQKKFLEFKVMARTLNAKNDGDQAIFYLKKQ